MSVVSKKRRQAKRAAMPKTEGPRSLTPVKTKKAQRVRRPKSVPKISLTRLLQHQEYQKSQKKAFRLERAQQKPILEAAKKKEQKAAKRLAKEQKKLDLMND